MDRTRQRTVETDLGAFVTTARSLLRAGDQFILPEKQSAFRQQAPVQELDLILRSLEQADRTLPPEQKIAVERQVTPDLPGLVEIVSKHYRASTNGSWLKAREGWIELHTICLRRQRRLELEYPRDEDAFVKTLQWMAERGGEAELDLLRHVAQTPRFAAPLTLRLLVKADAAMTRRVYDPTRVTQAGEEAYQRHRSAWDAQHAGEFIAIHRGQLVAHSADKMVLYAELTRQQQQQGVFRAYVVEIGAPVLEILSLHSDDRPANIV